MHIHGNSMSVNPANFSSVGDQQTAAAAERAAETRKRLMKAPATDTSTPEETLMISQWLDSRHSQVLTPDQQRTANSGSDPNLG